MKKIVFLCCCLLAGIAGMTEDGYRLWLRYAPVDNAALLTQYRNAIQGIQVPGNSPTLSATREELLLGLESMLGKKIPVQNTTVPKGIVAGTPATSPFIASLHLGDKLKQAGEEGFVITTHSGRIVIAGNTEIGVLYGAFHFLSL